jgi:hypothetical protein
VRGSYAAAEVYGVTGDRFALYHHVGGDVEIAEPDQCFPIELESLGFEIVTVSPMENGVAFFGLIDKFNGSRAIERAHWKGGEDLEIDLADGGRVGWCSDRKSLGALFHGRPVEVQSRGNLSWVILPEGEPVTLTLRFARASANTRGRAEESGAPELQGQGA